jgi:hypothetical protein
MRTKIAIPEVSCNTPDFSSVKLATRPQRCFRQTCCPVTCRDIYYFRWARHIFKPCEQHSPYHHVFLLHAVCHGATVPEVPLVEKAPHTASAGELNWNPDVGVLGTHTNYFRLYRKAKSLAAEPEGSTPPIPMSTTGHDPEPVPSSSHPHSPFSNNKVFLTFSRTFHFHLLS